MTALQLIVVQIVTFSVFLWVLKLVFYNDLAKAKNRLSALNQQNMEKEQELKEKMEAAQKESRRVLDEASAEAEKVRSAAQIEAERINKSMKEEAEKEREILLKREKENLERMKKEMMIKMEKKIVKTACDVVANIFSQAAREKVHVQLVEEFIEEINGLENDRIDLHADHGEVVSPFPVSSMQRERLEETLLRKTGKKISLGQEIEEDLIVGLKLNLAGLILDGSLQNRLEKVKRSVC